jgi:hypothetical protein
MEREKFGIFLLLGLLLLLSTVIGSLHAQQAPGQKQPDRLTQVEVEGLISSLVESQSIEGIVKVMASASFEVVRSVITRLVVDKRMRSDDVAQVIFGLALEHKDEPQEQNNLFGLFSEIPTLRTGSPLAFVAATSIYHDAIPLLVTWIKEHEAQQPWPATILTASLYYAVDHNNLAALKTLCKQGGPITKEQATDLLWRAVTEGKRSSLVQFLKGVGADVATARDGYTPLMKAAELGLVDVVRELLKAADKAIINKIVDPKIGTALQLALDGQYSALKKNDSKMLDKFREIEKLLRKAGARED